MDRCPFPSPAFRSIVGAAALLALASHATAQGVPTTLSHLLDDPDILYSEYVCAHVDSTSASFDRVPPTAPFCQQDQMSPGTRASFRTKATHVRFRLDYLDVGAACDDGAMPVNWEFGLEIDGVPPAGANPLYPLGSGDRTPWVALPGDGAAHTVSLIWPAGADVDLTELTLKGVYGSTPPTLLSAPSRPASLLGAFGDSITHGLYASHVSKTYPALVASAWGWSVVNLGFAGRETRSTDGEFAAGVDSCSVSGGVPRGQALDLLVLAIGSNDFHLPGGGYTAVGDFATRYADLLAEYRALDDGPVLCVTPIPRPSDECGFCNRTLEQYREEIRAAIDARDDPDIYLVEGRDLVRPDLALFDPDELHPNDDGFADYAQHLIARELVRNGGFELRPLTSCTCPLSGCDPCAEVGTADAYLWDETASGASAPGTSDRWLELDPGAEVQQVVFGLSDGEAYSFSAVASGDAGTITLEFWGVSGPLGGAEGSEVRDVTAAGTYTVNESAPTGAVRCVLTLSNASGAGDMTVDDVSLTVAAF